MTEEPVLQSLPPEEAVVFENSGATLALPKDFPLHPRALLAALLAILAASAGVYVGLDYLDGDTGMYTHRQLIYTQSVGAPNESAILTGVLHDSEGNPLVNYSLEGHLTYRRNAYATTSENGSFRMEGLDPGQMILDIASPNGDRLTNLILLNAPAGFEPLGFTNLAIEWPTESEFDNAEPLQLGGNWIDLSDSQKENSTQLYDQTAAAMYDMFGTGFIGLGVITMALAAIGIRNKNAGVIRTATVTAFFSMGHFYISCGFGLLGFLLTLTLIKRE